MAEEELRPQHETLQARDKVVLKMTRDGAAEENLTQGSTERISQRDRKSTRLNSSHWNKSRMPSSA